MTTLHPKVFEYLIKSYYYVGESSYEYLLELLNVLPLSNKFNLEELKEEYRNELRKNSPNLNQWEIEKESIIWSLENQMGKIYDALLKYLKSLPSEDIYNLLLSLLPDTQFKRMGWDNWNYYGEYVKDWHKNLYHYLELSGIKYDAEKRQLVQAGDELDIKK